MEIKYQIFENENLIMQKYSGIFSLEFYKIYTGFIIKNFSSNAIEKVLIDFRGLYFENLPDGLPDDYHNKIEKIVEFRKSVNENELRNKNVKLVIWVDKPLPTVIAHLFIQNFPAKNYHYCSTVDNVIKILQLTEDFNNLESRINNLENEFEIG
jgi:hypothetical protein